MSDLRFSVLSRPKPGDPPSRGPALAQLVDEWLDLKGRLIKPRTLANRKCVARTWVGCLGDLDPRAIGPQEIQQLYALRDCGGRANQTLNSERHRLKEFWKWLIALGHADTDPTSVWPTKNPRKRKRKYLHVTREWEDRILPHLRERYRRFFRFDLCVGLRYGEVRVLRWSWITLDGVLGVPAEYRKQGEPLRLPLPRRALEALGARGGPEELVFPELPTPQACGKALKRAGRRAGFPGAEHLSPHQLRRSWRGRLVRAEVPRDVIKDLGGWASDADMDYYWSGTEMAEARNYLERI